MKHIFDWLREQIDKYSYDTETCGGRYIDIIEEKDIVRLVDEAEAKWESDCCEWKVLHEKCFIQNPHTKRMFSNEPSMQNFYCNTCGKPIKISEVE